MHRYPIALVELLWLHSDVLILILCRCLQSCSGRSSVVNRVGCHLSLKVFLRLKLFCIILANGSLLLLLLLLLVTVGEQVASLSYITVQLTCFFDLRPEAHVNVLRRLLLLLRLLVLRCSSCLNFLRQLLISPQEIWKLSLTYVGVDSLGLVLDVPAFVVYRLILDLSKLALSLVLLVSGWGILARHHPTLVGWA